MKMFIILLVFTVATAQPVLWTKKDKYTLPEGAELLVGPIRSTFTCFSNGYYADVDNNCQVFHICSHQVGTDGKVHTQQYSFVCGNQTMFNQLTFTCSYPEDAVPCIHAQDFYYLNNHIETDDPEVHFLEDQDVQRAAPLIEADQTNRRVEKPLRQGYQPSRRRFEFDNHNE